MKETTKAYLAGIIDGEGCITISRWRKHRNYRTPRYELRIIVVMTHKPTIDFISDNMPYGSSCFLHKPSVNGRKPSWKWVATNTFAAEILGHLLPYFITKRQQALLAIEFIQERGDGRRLGSNPCPPDMVAKRERFYAQMSKLNKKGM